MLRRVAGRRLRLILGLLLGRHRRLVFCVLIIGHRRGYIGSSVLIARGLLGHVGSVILIVSRVGPDYVIGPGTLVVERLLFGRGPTVRWPFVGRLTRRRIEGWRFIDTAIREYGLHIRKIRWIEVLEERLDWERSSACIDGNCHERGRPVLRRWAGCLNEHVEVLRQRLHFDP